MDLTELAGGQLAVGAAIKNGHTLIACELARVRRVNETEPRVGDAQAPRLPCVDRLIQSAVPAEPENPCHELIRQW